MKSVTFSEVVRTRERTLLSTASAHQLALFGLVLAAGLPGLIIGFHLLDPAAPLAYIVGPIIAGALLPVLAAGPGRFEVNTRFNALHLVDTLDNTLGKLGYAAAERQPGAVRYRVGRPGWLPWKRADIAVTLRDHKVEIVGPFNTLRALQQQLAR